jgi:hypothetical protein
LVNFNYSLQKIDYTLSFFLNAIAFSYHQGKRPVSLIREFWDTCIYREPINILEELNDETLATVIPNMLRLARENLIKRARLFLQMKGGHFEHLL